MKELFSLRFEKGYSIRCQVMSSMRTPIAPWTAAILVPGAICRRGGCQVARLVREAGFRAELDLRQ